jgi:hypothetical protein
MLDSEIASIFDEKLTYESEVWNNFTSVQYWAEMSMKELLNRIDEIVEDYLNYGEEDDENKCVLCAASVKIPACS